MIKRERSMAYAYSHQVIVMHTLILALTHLSRTEESNRNKQNRYKTKLKNKYPIYLVSK